MKRVAIVGTPGAGKSTLARALGARAGLPTIHLDQHYFQPGWLPRAESEWDEIFDRLLAGEEWVIDGAFAMEKAADRADTIVFLDFAPWRGYLGSMKRLARAYLGKRAPDFAPGCEDKLDREFFRLLKMIRGFPRELRPELVAQLDRLQAEGKRVLVVRNRKELRRVLDQFR
jgi:adenylate kinase family enzyme